MRNEISEKIRGFLADNFFVDADEASLPATESLTQGGTIDSMGVLELIMFIEEEWDFKIPDEDTTPDNLDTVECITAYVLSRTGTPENA
ncbi:MAG TPA: acyl carrier protein [Deinococcales bacterium]|nr:acyl carrier protein [Deinococcales bacterium]